MLSGSRGGACCSLLAWAVHSAQLRAQPAVLQPVLCHDGSRAPQRRARLPLPAPQRLPCQSAQASCGRASRRACERAAELFVLFPRQARVQRQADSGCARMRHTHLRLSLPATPPPHPTPTNTPHALTSWQSCCRRCCRCRCSWVPQRPLWPPAVACARGSSWRWPRPACRCRWARLRRRCCCRR